MRHNAPTATQLFLPWLFPAAAPSASEEAARPPAPSLHVVCPHCTNTDTLTLHCRNDRCGWVHCTCGALIYSRRRHRHPRHRTRADTCHDPAAAV